MKALQASIWTYNYDFEFELGKQHRILLHDRELAPWFYLNRSTNFLLPFLENDDALVTYPGVNLELTGYLTDHLGISPTLFTPSLNGSESNSVLSDLLAPKDQLLRSSGYQLKPWGWSPKANEFNSTLTDSRHARFSTDLVRKVNSKQTSTLLRETLPDSYKIPSQIVTNDNTNLKNLEELILSFSSEHGAFFVKNFYGTSGRQSDFHNSSTFSSKKIRRWNHWIAETGGILLEKAVQVQQEFSLQLSIEKNGTILPIALTDMFSTSNGSYLGNIIYRNQNIPEALLKNLLPLIQVIADEGYHGPVGVDFIQTKTGEVKLLEINCRITMGRVAYEWIKKLDPSEIGLFANFFVPSSKFLTFNSFFTLANNLSKAYNCSFLPINFVPSKQNSNSLVSICIGANTKDAAFSLIDEIKPSLFKAVNF